MTSRKAEVARKTAETDISVKIDLDGSGKAAVQTSIPFFDHMLTLMAKHGFLDLEINAQGDTEVDFHHTVEDAGLTLGEALGKALGDRSGIKRYGQATVPMDEALATVSIDLCSRPYLVYQVDLSSPQSGGFDANLAEQFFRALAGAIPATLHLNLDYGSNLHHVLEALFKAFGRALGEASSADSRLKGVLSTKGSL